MAVGHVKLAAETIKVGQRTAVLARSQSANTQVSSTDSRNTATTRRGFCSQTYLAAVAHYPDDGKVGSAHRFAWKPRMFEDCFIMTKLCWSVEEGNNATLPD